MRHKLYTIGHSASPLEAFLSALEQLHVNCLMDVRSIPRSRRFPHFNQSALAEALKIMGARYIFAGKELGGRPDDPQMYAADGVVDYSRRRQSAQFQQGVKQVMHQLTESDVALMCAEEDPLNCHRFLMISPALVALGLEPLHFRKGGVIETQQEAEDRLLHENKLDAASGNSLFCSDRAAALDQAYSAQAHRHAFRRGKK